MQQSGDAHVGADTFKRSVPKIPFQLALFSQTFVPLFESFLLLPSCTTGCKQLERGEESNGCPKQFRIARKAEASTERKGNSAISSSSSSEQLWQFGRRRRKRTFAQFSFRSPRRAETVDGESGGKLTPGGGFGTRRGVQ